MTQPGQIPIPQHLLLRWNCGYSDISPVARICQFQFAQGSLQGSITCSPEDFERLGQDIINCARRAKTDLAQASSMPDLQLPKSNGNKGREG